LDSAVHEWQFEYFSRLHCDNDPFIDDHVIVIRPPSIVIVVVVQRVPIFSLHEALNHTSLPSGIQLEVVDNLQVGNLVVPLGLVQVSWEERLEQGLVSLGEL
jgi:hypothetical protein